MLRGEDPLGDLQDYPEIQSVVHVHPRFTVLMSMLQQPLVPMCQEGAQLVSRPIPVYPHVKTILSDEEGREVSPLPSGDRRSCSRATARQRRARPSRSR